MADATPIEPDHLPAAPRPLTPIRSRRWAGFPAAPFPPIGRESEVETLCDLLRDPRHRLVTVTGPGGVGKTRLALAAAEQLAAHFADGAAFVALADINDPALIPAAVARTLDVRESPDRPMLEALVAALRDRRLLLVLDNCEHLAGAVAAAAIGALADGCPDLAILVTSREPLHLRDERVLPTPALAIPDADAAPDPMAAAEFGAVALFVERARMAAGSFDLTADDTRTVVEICRRLDGLPLAIELAAAWVRVLPPAALLARLEPRLPLLRSGFRDQPARFRTMRDAIAWSYDLLSDAERQCLRGLSVFVGGFSLEAAEWVSGVGLRVTETDRDGQPAAPDTRHPTPDTLELLASLIDKSLVQQTTPTDGDPRFAMLDTVREFARERLSEHGEEEAAAAAHAAWMIDLAERAANAAGGVASGDWMRRLAAERSNLWVALDWLERTGQTAAALRMTGALWRYWYRLGDLTEGRVRLERALAAAPPGVDPAPRARALRGAGVLAWQAGDYDHSRERLDAALIAYESLGDQAGAAWVRNSLGCLFATLADEEQAERYLIASLESFQALSDASGAAQLTANLGELAEAAGHHDLAIERLDTALSMWHALDNRVGAARAQIFLAQALLARGQRARAEAVLHTALAAIRDIDYEQILPAALRTAAHLAARSGDAARAARWYGAEERVRETLGMQLPAGRRAQHERSLATVRGALGQDAFAAAWADGRRLSAAQVIEEAMAGSSSPAPLASGPPVVSTTGAVALSPREREVLRLIVAGRSDRDIAAALYIGQRTASTHVAAILRKLEVATRAEAAVRAVRDGLV